jgi:hypothetical protein
VEADDALLDDFEPYHVVARATTPRREGQPSKLEDSQVLGDIAKNLESVDVDAGPSVNLRNREGAERLVKALDRLAAAATAAAYAEDANKRGRYAVV